MGPTINIADPDGSGPFWPDLDPDVWDRIRIRIQLRILALLNDLISTFLVCYSLKSVKLNFLVHK
jgi:hypothetical protein